MVSNGTFHMSNLAITSWNIHGIFSRIESFRYNKLQSPYFWDMIGNAKIFGLIETHHLATEIDQIQINGYKCFNVCRKKRATEAEILVVLLCKFATQYCRVSQKLEFQSYLNR